MNLFALSGLLFGATSVILGILTFIKARKLLHYIWGVFCFSVALWGFGSYKIAIELDPVKAILWWRIAYIGVIFIPVLFAHFVYKFLDLSKKWLIKIIYLIAFLFLMTNFINGLFINKVRFVFNQFYYISPPAILYTPFVILFLGLVIHSHIKLVRAYKRITGIQKTQIKYIFLATIVGFSGGAIAFLPVYKIDLYPCLNFMISFSSIIVIYAIFRYRLMDVRFVLGRGAVYVFSFATVIASAFGLIFLNQWLGQPLSFYVLGPIAIVLSIILFQGFFRFYERIASRYFYHIFYSYQKVITDLGKKLTEVLELNKLTSLIADTLINTMKLDKAGVLLRDVETGLYQIQKIIGFKEENGISLVRDNFLTLYLEKTKKSLVYEELGLTIRDIKNEKEKACLQRLQSNMKRIEAALCLPLFREDKIIGIIILGDKISKESYSEQDLDLLTTLSNQASVALENARLYDQIQDFSQNLQQKVDEQTKKIRKAYEVEKKAHKELQRLDEAKNQFIMATQHHLRTPLTSMRGYVDLILGGSYGKIPKKLKEVILKFQTSASREIKIVDELLDISQFQLGKEVVSLQPDIRIEPILKEVTEELKFETDTKRIYLKLEKPKTKLPSIKADPEKLKVALFNIVDNAIKYTNKGGVIVSLKIKDSSLQIIVKDTGMGIPKEELDTLFTRIFERSKEAQKTYTTGRGIGLYITFHIIQAHKGKIWAESGGKDRGTTFYVELPTAMTF